MPAVLIVDDDEESRVALRRLCEQLDFEVSEAGSVKEARAVLRHQPTDLVLLDLKLPDGTGLDLVDELDRQEVIMVTGSPSIDSATIALRYRFRDYLTKPVDLARIRSHLEEVRAAAAEPAGDSEAESDGPAMVESPMIGESEAIRVLDQQLTRVAPTDASVLIVGESGTGKELTARNLHARSGRAREPFVAINCGAVPENLIESELFGHKKGAFTGADRDRRGVFERAHGGTLFLDEITEMTADMQTRLLRVLEESTLQRVGSEETIEFDVRIVAATNRNPAEAIREGTLREDLFYRLCVFQLSLPALRQRPGDIEVLAEHFIDKFNADAGTEKSLADPTLEALKAFSWPGNVRQLKNALYHAFIMAESTIEADHLPPLLEPEEPRGEVLTVPADLSIAEMEKRLIRAALDRFSGDRKQAAEALGISERTLYNRLKEYRKDDDSQD